MEGTLGAQVISKLTPQKEDFSLHKRIILCFFLTGLDSLLRELKAEDIILAGVATDICVLSTAATCFFNGYHEILPPETTEPLKAETKQDNLNYMQNNYQAEILSLDQVIGHWKKKFKEAFFNVAVKNYNLI